MVKLGGMQCLASLRPLDCRPVGLFLTLLFQRTLYIIRFRGLSAHITRATLATAVNSPLRFATPLCAASVSPESRIPKLDAVITSGLEARPDSRAYCDKTRFQLLSGPKPPFCMTGLPCVLPDCLSTYCCFHSRDIGVGRGKQTEFPRISTKICRCRIKCP